MKITLTVLIVPNKNIRDVIVSNMKPTTCGVLVYYKHKNSPYFSSCIYIRMDIFWRKEAA